jgi:hypothetical protein
MVIESEVANELLRLKGKSTFYQFSKHNLVELLFEVSKYVNNIVNKQRLENRIFFQEVEIKFLPKKYYELKMLDVLLMFFQRIFLSWFRTT